MSAESSWTLLKVIWQSCPDRFPNEIDPSIHHTTPTFVEQPFRISFSPFLSRSDPVSTFDSMLDSTLPRLSFRSNNSPSFPVSLQGRTSSRRLVCSCLAETRHPLPAITQLSAKRSFLIAASISISKISRHFSKFLREILSRTKSDSLGTISKGELWGIS